MPPPLIAKNGMHIFTKDINSRSHWGIIDHYGTLSRHFGAKHCFQNSQRTYTVSTLLVNICK